MLSKNALRTYYELATNFFFESGVRGRNFEQFKTLAPNSRLTYELQEVITNYKIQLRTTRNNYDSATNTKIYQFVGIRGSSGHSGIPPYINFVERELPMILHTKFQDHRTFDSYIWQLSWSCDRDHYINLCSLFP